MSSNGDLPTGTNENAEALAQLPSMLAALSTTSQTSNLPSTNSTPVTATQAVPAPNLPPTNSNPITATQAVTAPNVVAPLAGQPLVPFVWGLGSQFHPFRRLPVELSRAIWTIEATQSPCLVHWRPGGRRPPAILSANREAREIGLRYYRIFFNVLNRSGFYGLYVNPDTDTVFRLGMLPNMVRQRYNRLPLPNIMNVVPGVGGPVWNHPGIGTFVRRLMITTHEATRAIGIAQRGRQSVWEKLRTEFPVLEELIILVPRQFLPTHLNDVRQVFIGFGTQRELDLMNRIQTEFNQQQARGRLLGVRLLFRTVM